MHYPPCLCGHAFMDSKYPMKHIEKVQEAFESISNIGGIFCGHYHCAHSLELKNGIPVYVAPASQMQISPTSAEFKLESSLPFWQILNFKGKNLTNTRTSSKDHTVVLKRPRLMSLEVCLDYIGDDELVEVTPQNYRLRKKILNTELRKKASIKK